MSCAIFRTGLRAPHMVLAGDLVPAGTVLVTNDLYRVQKKTKTIRIILKIMYNTESQKTALIDSDTE